MFLTHLLDLPLALVKLLRDTGGRVSCLLILCLECSCMFLAHLLDLPLALIKLLHDSSDFLCCCILLFLHTVLSCCRQLRDTCNESRLCLCTSNHRRLIRILESFISGCCGERSLLILHF